MAGDDLTPLFHPPNEPTPLGYRQGTVLAWNSTTAANTIQIGASTCTNLPILNSGEALLLYPGAVVGLLSTGLQMFILGRITIPGSPDAVSTLGAGMQVAYVPLNTGPLSNDTLALNSGPTITTSILQTGRAFVTGTSGMDLDVGEAAELLILGAGPNGATWASKSSLIGDNFLSASSPTVLGGTLSISASTADMATGLTPGTWTFSLQSRRGRPSGGPSLWGRVLTVMPL